MRRGLLASGLLILAAVAGIAAMGRTSSQASGAPGSWSSAASLMTGRAEHTATLLRNGNVLVAGGLDRTNKAMASAEVYNPSTDRWTSAGSMATARLDHTATLLASGKVLVAGGQGGPDPSSSITSTELYDPTTGTWSSAAPMIVSRVRHTATLLADGRVLVVGGLTLVVGSGGLFPSPATDPEIYDPVANRWSMTAPMGFDRVGQTVTRLVDGRVLVAGGVGGAGTLTSTQIYNATEDRWISAAPMGIARSGHVATPLPNGDVFVAGGTNEDTTGISTTLTSGEIYGPRTNRWVTVASMVDADRVNTATLLRNGMVLVVGLDQSQAEIYDPARNAWSRKGPTIGGHQGTLTSLADGRAVLVGGYGSESFAGVLVYDPNGVHRGPLDPRLIAAVSLAVVLLVVGSALSIPAVRRRLKALRPPDQTDEWIT